MTPYLSGVGRSVLALAAVLLLVGAASGVLPALVLGWGLIAALAYAWYGAARIARDLTEGGVRVEVELDQDATMRGLHRGDRPVLLLRVHNATGAWRRGLRVVGLDCPGLAVTHPWDAPLDLPPGTTTVVRVPTQAVRVGAYAIHGFFVQAVVRPGWVTVEGWMRAGLHLDVLPSRQAPGRLELAPPSRVLPVSDPGQRLARRKGDGAELRELREWRTGDALRRVAWNASARLGRLVVRELEDDRQTTAWVVLDVASGMFGGESSLKWQQAVDLADRVVRSWVARQDRVGLLAFDTDVVAHHPPVRGLDAVRCLHRQILVCSASMHPDATEADEHELAAIVAEFLYRQTRLDLREGPLDKRATDAPWQAGDVEIDAVRRWILAKRPDASTEWERAAAAAGVDLSRWSLLRKFAAASRIPVQPRLEARPGLHERALASALTAAMGRARESRPVLVISDLNGIVDLKLVTDALDGSRAAGHRVVVAAPWSPSFTNQEAIVEQPTIEQAVMTAFALAERRERTRISDELLAHGAQVVFWNATDDPAQVFSRVAQAIAVDPRGGRRAMAARRAVAS